MSKAAKPFAYRGKWRIQVTLKNGKRPAENFIKHADALQWAADTLANDNSAHEAQLGGPTQAMELDLTRFHGHCVACSLKLRDYLGFGVDGVFLMMFPFKVIGREIAQGRVAPVRVVPALDSRVKTAKRASVLVFQLRRAMNSHSKVAKKLSAMALS